MSNNFKIKNILLSYNINGGGIRNFKDAKKYFENAADNLIFFNFVGTQRILEILD